MKRLKVLLLTLPAIVFAVSVATLPLGVSAEEGNDDATTTANTEDARKLENEHKQRGKTLLQEAREKRTTKTDEQRQAACEKRKSGLQRKVNNLSTNAEKYLSRIDEVFAKAQAFQSQKNLTVASYDELVAAAKASQAKADTSVTALKSLAPTIDCASNTVPTDVATFKVAAQQARTDLRTYKQDVKEVLKAIRTAFEAAKTEEQ